MLESTIGYSVVYVSYGYSSLSSCSLLSRLSSRASPSSPKFCTQLEVTRQQDWYIVLLTFSHVLQLAFSPLPFSWNIFGLRCNFSIFNFKIFSFHFLVSPLTYWIRYRLLIVTMTMTSTTYLHFMCYSKFPNWLTLTLFFPSIVLPQIRLNKTQLSLVILCV